MSPMENRLNPVTLAIGILVAAGLYLFLNRRAWLRQHAPIPMHPAAPRPGTIPRMARGLR